MLTWNFSYFWSLLRGVSPRLQRGHANGLSSRAGAAMSRFPSGRSWDVWVSLEAFPLGFPTRISHRAVQRATVVGVHLRRESRGSGAKQVPLEWSETSAGLLEWGHDPGVTLAFPVESTSTSDATGTPGMLSQRSRERIPYLELRGGIGAPLDVGGTLVLPLEWRPVCRETS